MKIYTKGGDAGETSLYGGKRVFKDDQRLRTYGTLDELNACLGVAIAQRELDPDLNMQLTRVQGELFELGAELAGSTQGLLEEDSVEHLEQEIDRMEGRLEPLKSFILPGGSAPSAALHVARTVSRRAERELIALHRTEPQRPEVLRYVNRLSDYLFVCARSANARLSVADVPWAAARRARSPRKNSTA